MSTLDLLNDLIRSTRKGKADWQEFEKTPYGVTCSLMNDYDKIYSLEHGSDLLLSARRGDACYFLLLDWHLEVQSLLSAENFPEDPEVLWQLFRLIPRSMADVDRIMLRILNN